MISDLEQRLRAAWCAETSAYEDWAPVMPSRGQCAVTALVVQDELGGKLIRALVDGESHYWNELPDGTEVDLTRDQFVQFDPRNRSESDRAYILSFEATARRYRLLRSRL